MGRLVILNFLINMSIMSESKDLCKLDRQLNLVKKIVIVDGMIGGGKKSFDLYSF